MMKWVYKKKFTQILKYNFDYKINYKMPCTISSMGMKVWDSQGVKTAYVE